MAGRFLYIVLDGVGVGALPDAADYGDTGANTLGNLAQLVDLCLPTLALPGAGLHPAAPGGPPGSPAVGSARASGRAVRRQGHYGRPLGAHGGGDDPALPHLPRRLPRGRARGPSGSASGAMCWAIGPPPAPRSSPSWGRNTCAPAAPSSTPRPTASSRSPLTSTSSRCPSCTVSAPWRASLLTGPHAVARVIARPFTGEPGRFTRTADRKDFSLAPPAPTYLDLLSGRGVPVLGVGKISQIFAGRGVAEEHKVASNDDNLAYLARALAERTRWAHHDQPGRLRHGLGAPERRGGLRRRAGSRGRRPAGAALTAGPPGPAAHHG